MVITPTRIVATSQNWLVVEEILKDTLSGHWEQEVISVLCEGWLGLVRYHRWPEPKIWCAKSWSFQNLIRWYSTALHFLTSFFSSLSNESYHLAFLYLVYVCMHIFQEEMLVLSFGFADLAAWSLLLSPSKQKPSTIHIFTTYNRSASCYHFDITRVFSLYSMITLVCISTNSFERLPKGTYNVLVDLYNTALVKFLGKPNHLFR